MSFDGREIFRRAVKGMAREIHLVMDELGWDFSDIDLVIPHQANQRILEALAKYLGISGLTPGSGLRVRVRVSRGTPP